MSKEIMKLLQFSIAMIALGMVVGVLCGVGERGWSGPTWAKWLFGVGSLGLLACAIAGFRDVAASMRR